MKFKPTPIALALILGAGALPLANAQYDSAQGGSAAQGNPPSQQSAQVSDSDLALFQKASGKIAEIRQDYQKEQSQAKDAKEAQSLQAKASQSMVEAVQSFGLTVEQFNQIAAAVQSDPNIRERLDEMQDS